MKPAGVAPDELSLGRHPLRQHYFLGMTQSVCPGCLKVIPAKIIQRQGRVYFQKYCPEHGSREDFVCSDDRWFDRMDYNVPGREPMKYGIQPQRGCPYDCGLCTQHEQHTCIGVLEITDACNLSCPLCYAGSGPGRPQRTVAECERAIRRLIEVEGRAEILQLSGGEPTLHPDFETIFEFACSQPIDLVMINTNGIRLAQDGRLLETLAAQRPRCQVYLQLDGLRDQDSLGLRGVSLLDIKLKAIERLGEFGINTTLVCTLQGGLNAQQIGPLVEFARQRPWVTGVSFQPATYVGRWLEPESLEHRITFPDVLRAVEAQTQGLIREHDFFPIPCAHPNSHTLCYCIRAGSEITPITRFVDLDRHYDLLANGISLTREGTREIIAAYLRRNACGSGCDCGPLPGAVGLSTRSADSQLANDRPSTASHDANASLLSLAQTFFARAMQSDLSASDMFRVTTTSFMDAYNFDLRQLMKSCVHHVLPSGHLIPFDAYNLFYRSGVLPLPPLSPELVQVGTL